MIHKIMDRFDFSNESADPLEYSHVEDDNTFLPQAGIFGPILVILIIAGIVGNLFTIATIICIRRLRTVPNYLSINLAISDLVTAAFVNSLLLNNILTNTHLEVNSFACDLTGYASSVTPITSLMILCTIAFQRYCASSQNSKLKAINKSKAKMAFDISLPWITATIFDVVLNKVLNEGHIWDRKIHMCIYVHTDWRVSTTHFAVLVTCTLLIFGSHWSLSRATYRWPSIQLQKLQKATSQQQNNSSTNSSSLFIKNQQKNGVTKPSRSSFYISVAGKTVSLQSYQAFKVRASLRRTFLLLLVFVFTCFPWYSLALINSLWPLGDSAPSIVWLTAAVLEHANCSLNFFINNAASQRYRKFVAKHLPLPPIIAQRLARASRSAIALKEIRRQSTMPGSNNSCRNGSSTSCKSKAGHTSFDLTCGDSDGIMLRDLEQSANGTTTIALEPITDNAIRSGHIFQEGDEDGTVFLQI